MEAFGARLLAAVADRGPLCVGIDPHASLLREWGVGDDASGLRAFCETVVEAIGEVAAVVKPQSAFFERFGSTGIAVLESTIRHLRDTGAIVLLDVKRGDIGSTASAYASAYLDPSSPLHVDAITATPYLGFGALRPMIDQATASGGGVFVVTLSSNPEGAAVQQAQRADGRTVAQAVLDEISQVNAGVTPLGSIGAVVGATIGTTGHDVSSINGPILAPGMGEQGGTPESLRSVLGGHTVGVLPAYSRQILSQGPSATGVRDAALRARDACGAVLGF